MTVDILLRLCALLGLSGIEAAIFPEAQLNGNELGWKYNRSMWVPYGVESRITHPELCRRKPPDIGRDIATFMYVIAYSQDARNKSATSQEELGQPCSYYFVDERWPEIYELKLQNEEIAFFPETCRPPSSFIGMEQSCPMTIVDPTMFIIYCMKDAWTVDAYLMLLVKGGDGFLMKPLSVWSLDKQPDYIVNKHLQAAIRVQPDDENILIVENNLKWILHIQLENHKGKIVDWISGSGDVGKEIYKEKLEEFNVTQIADCKVDENDGHFCEVSYDNGALVVNKINGAFNQFECLRVRRGKVHYYASVQSASGADFKDPFGYIIEVFDQNSREILSQKCYFSPEFTRERHNPGNILPIWVGSAETYERICTDGIDKGMRLPIIEPKELEADNVCQTAVFPPLPYNFTIVGLEPLNSKKRLEYGIPQLAVYNGYDAEPEYRGDPQNLLYDNCQIDENGEPTSLAHFGIRMLNNTHFVVFCNRGYGPDYEPDRETTVFLYEYERNTKALTVLHHSRQAISVSFSENHFLDNRGVVMLNLDENTHLFVQMRPCVVFMYNFTGNELQFDRREPNNDTDYTCQHFDIAKVVDKETYEKLQQCSRRACHNIDHPGQKFDPMNYYTRDILQEHTSVITGINQCIRSRLRLVKLNQKVHQLYRFESLEKVTSADPCFLPFELSAGFQLSAGSDFMFSLHSCRFDWATLIADGQINETEITTTGPIEEPPTATAQPFERSPTGELICNRKYRVDTVAAVAAVGLSLLISACIFASVVLAAMLGRRNYLAHKPKSLYTTIAAMPSTMSIAASQMAESNVQTAVPPEKAASSAPTDKVGSSEPDRITSSEPAPAASSDKIHSSEPTPNVSVPVSSKADESAERRKTKRNVFTKIGYLITRRSAEREA